MKDNVQNSFDVLQRTISAHSGHPSDDPFLYINEGTGKEIGIDGKCNAAQLRLIAQWLDDVAEVKAMLIRFPDGDARREDPLASVNVPDLWHCAEFLDDNDLPGSAEKVREAWHLAHDMLAQLRRGVGIGS